MRSSRIWRAAEVSASGAPARPYPNAPVTPVRAGIVPSGSAMRSTWKPLAVWTSTLFSIGVGSKSAGESSATAKENVGVAADVSFAWACANL